jgi:hypothetical protein
MRPINKHKVQPERLTLQTCKDSLKAIIQYKKKNTKTVAEISNYYYRGSDEDPKSTVYQLYKVYNNKCAFCEQQHSKLDVEHYRPKGNIEEEKNHTGYYWLCYEWTNLLMACKDCNRDWKTEHFPILGKRVFDNKIHWDNTDRQYVEAEELKKIEFPLLLNPEENGFLSNKYLKFNILGRMIGVDCEGRGKKTIEICNLNRPELKKRRFIEIDNIVQRIDVAICGLMPDFSNKATILVQLAKALNGLDDINDNDERVFLKEKILFDFEALILCQFPKEFHDIIMESYNTKFNNNGNT